MILNRLTDTHIEQFLFYNMYQNYVFLLQVVAYGYFAVSGVVEVPSKYFRLFSIFCLMTYPFY